MTETQAIVGIRAYSPTDLRAVLDLLQAALGAGPVRDRTSSFFRWKHFDNPFGHSYLVVAEDDGRIVGLRAFMRWRFVAGDRRISAVRAVDTATHPASQGRGIFSRLTLSALDDLAGDTDLIFNTPNEKSLPGYLKMGWEIVGEVPIRVRVRRPIRLLRHRRSVRSTETAADPGPAVVADGVGDVLEDGEDIAELLRDSEANEGAIATAKTVEYLRWRFADAPDLGYRAIREDRHGIIAGLAIFRVRPRGVLWETTLAELLVRRGDLATARRLFAAVVRASRVDHVTCSFSQGTTAAQATRWSSWKAPFGITLVTKPLRRSPIPDPGKLGSWSLSLGDLEVF
jgi:hypothetical protein